MQGRICALVPLVCAAALSACGGGGGGGPGGQGGYLVVNHQIDDMSAIDNFSGGTGGNGGLKGKSRQFCSSGEDGLPGETGFSGSILFSN